MKIKRRKMHFKYLAKCITLGKNSVHDNIDKNDDADDDSDNDDVNFYFLFNWVKCPALNR